jgi:hypothetical protein
MVVVAKIFMISVDYDVDDVDDDNSKVRWTLKGEKRRRRLCRSGGQ